MKRKLLTRKNKALRWLLAAAILTALLLLLTPLHLTAESAHHQAVAKRFIKPTEIVYQITSPASTRFLFSINDDTLCIGTAVRSRWQGWENTGLLTYVERDNQRPFAATETDDYVYDPKPEKTIHYFYVFGVVQDETVKEVGIEFDAITGGHDQSVRLTESEWLTTQSGERVFLWELEPEVGNWSRSCRITGYRADGTTTETLQIMGFPSWEE